MTALVFSEYLQSKERKLSKTREKEKFKENFARVIFN